MESTVAVVLLILVWVSVFCDGTVIVSKDGSGDYRTVGEAITEAPDLSEKPYTIHVRAGTYQEYILIPSHKTNIKLVGDGPHHTKIVGYQNGSTIDIRGEGFMAENMGFANWAGLNASGAVAVRNEGKKTIFFRCSIEGLQDTLWAVSGGQFYKDSDIYGTVDFIYGNAAAVFQDCTLYARYRPYVTFTAQSREDPNDNTGFTFQRCNFTISPQDSDRKSEVRATLGRPLRPYSRVAIFHSYIDSFVDPKGWEPMPHQPTDKATYIEFLNLGPGSHTDGRVQWPGVTRLLHPAQALPFTASYLLDADSWIPSTGVPYDNTL
ncbi:probable pectinesterase/pectinesterase inhibitor 46 isoform X1 [Cajanus cajan]|uniref:Pectinesterase/pectinesterase inhibitor 46 n=1 Tax=Cajanus cajan TaxID=3821 RepID=A0A151S6P7_CAJCA|nr:probable pectinesterase/pectinesterase inhibitor 46 isoform X1 [Cajanus cajan]KYP50421.1 putative pectinesterase/pectinesterase inhibitor 46 [Cajanus cajan]